MGKNKRVTCTRALGVTVCRVHSSGAVLTLPMDKKNTVPLTIYTSNGCPSSICKDLRKTVEKMNKDMSSPFQVKEVQVDRVKPSTDILAIPAIQIGSSVIYGTNFNEETLIEHAVRHFSPQQTF